MNVPKMTLEDFFAGCAVASGCFNLNDSGVPENITAKLAYDLAEAMMEEKYNRAKKNE